MKTSIILTLLMLPFFAFSQQSDPALAKEEYCMVLATQKLLSPKVTIQVDYGQEWKWFKDNRSVRDEEGKRKTFNSVIDALNYMASEGWVFVNAYAITVGGQNVYHYVLRRELTGDEELKETT